MPRTVINTETPLASYPVFPIAADSADITLVAADVVNKNRAAYGTATRLLVLARNTDGGAQTVTFTSVADGLNRTGDITAYSIGAGEFAAFVFERNGWRQADGNLYFEASNVAVTFAVIPL